MPTHASSVFPRLEPVIFPTNLHAVQHGTASVTVSVIAPVGVPVSATKLGDCVLRTLQWES